MRTLVIVKETSTFPTIITNNGETIANWNNGINWIIRVCDKKEICKRLMIDHELVKGDIVLVEESDKMIRLGAPSTIGLEINLLIRFSSESLTSTGDETFKNTIHLRGCCITHPTSGRHYYVNIGDEEVLEPIPIPTEIYNKAEEYRYIIGQGINRFLETFYGDEIKQEKIKTLMGELTKITTEINTLLGQ